MIRCSAALFLTVEKVHFSRFADIFSGFLPILINCFLRIGLGFLFYLRDVMNKTFGDALQGRQPAGLQITQQIKTLITNSLALQLGTVVIHPASKVLLILQGQR